MSNISTRDYLREAAALGAFLGVFALLLAIPAARAAEPGGAESDAAPIEASVEALVAEARAANLELEAAGATTAERRAGLEAARARYLPMLDLTARYTRADGGRVISFPVGDLLNPVYASLNQLTGQATFPPIANQEVRFLRSREQDSKLTLTQPLYDARLGAGRAAARANLEAASAAERALAGRLERDVREAYYRWLEARARVGILTATLELARENQRVNESLFRNGKITRDLVYRAEADVLEVEQAALAARNGVELAQSYVNLLRNAPFDRALPRASVSDADVARLKAGLATRTGGAGFGYTALAAGAVDRRAELDEFEATAGAAQAGERLARAAFKPQLAFAIDAGTQGERYAFGNDDRYVLASLVLKFNLFAGGADEAALSGARERLRAARAGKALAEQRIRLEVQDALQKLELAEASLGTAAKRVEAASGAFRIAARKRDLGQLNQAEFIDARRALTDAELNLNVTRYGALASLADLDYALGTRAGAPGTQP